MAVKNGDESHGTIHQKQKQKTNPGEGNPSKLPF